MFRKHIGISKSRPESSLLKGRSAAAAAALAVAAMSAAPMALAESVWTQTGGGSFSWLDAPNWAGGAVPNGVDDAAGIIAILTDPQTITLDAAITLGQLTIAGGTTAGYTIENGTGGPLTFETSAGNAMLTLNAAPPAGGAEIAADLVINSTLELANNAGGDRTMLISGSISGSADLLVSWGVHRLGGANNLTGSSAVSAGTLVLDYSAENNDKISSAGSLTLGSAGTLAVASVQLLGNAGAASSQTVDGLSVQGLAGINLAGGAEGQAMTLHLGSISRWAGSFLNVTLGDDTALLTTDSSIGRWATISNADFARVAGGQIVAFDAADYNTLTTGATINTTSQAVRIDDSSSGNFGVASGAAIDSILFNDPAGGRSINLADSLKLSQGAIFLPAGAGGLTISNGSLTSGTSELILHNRSTAGAIVVNSGVGDNNGGAVALAVSGGGRVELNNTSNTYSGGTILGGGTVKIMGSDSLGSGDINFIRPSTLEFGAGGITLDGGRTIMLAGGTNTFNVLAGNTAQVDSQITGGGSLMKTPTSGTLILTNANSFNGFIINTGGAAGTVEARHPLALGGGTVTTGNQIGQVFNLRWDTSTAFGPGAGYDITARHSTTFDLGALTSSAGASFSLGSVNVTAASNLTVQGAAGYELNLGTYTNTLNQAGGAPQIVANNPLTIDQVVMNAAGTGVATLTLGGSANTTITGGITQVGKTTAITKAGAGTLIIHGPGDYTGVTTLGGNAGPVEIRDLMAFGNTSGIAAQANSVLRIRHDGGGVVGPGGGYPVSITSNFTLDVAPATPGSGDKTFTLGNVSWTAGNLTFNGSEGNGAAFGGFNMTGTGGTFGLTLNANIPVSAASFSFDQPQSRTVTFQGSGSFSIGTGITQTSTGVMTLTKAQAGTLHIGGASTYTGNTNLNGGTLSVGHHQALGTGTLNILANTTILVSAPLAGAVTNPLGAFNNHSIGGAHPVEFTSDVNLTTIRTLTVSNPELTYSGVLSNGGLTKAGAGILALAGVNTYSAATTVNAGTLQLNHHQALNSASSLIINDGGAVRLQPGLAEAVVRPVVPTFNGSAMLDVTDNAIVFQSASLTAVNSLVSSGRNGGSWDGAGIKSSAAAANSTTHALGIVQDGSEITVGYTFLGDANMSGTVTIADLSLLATNWQRGVDDGQTAYWFHGDFNYDGRVTIADLSILASNWQAGVPAGTPMMSFAEAMAMFDVFNGVVIPEPAALSLVGLGLLSVRRRRKG